ncbi:MAG TPA: NAD(P)/FAD-dependent oxidoreductase [Vicinamibacterales bacterium]|nr:NAD(P)/FAD-dependent oxidoreductase [Vicinamibacterales bacterium]
MRTSADAIVIGSGPNGLSAAIVLAQAGCRVTVFEAEETIGGGVRSAALTQAGFVHDVCSAVYPMAAASPFFRTLPLASYGLEWVEPGAMLAHPFDDGSAAVVYRSIDQTAAGLGRDEHAYRSVLGPIADNWSRLEGSVLGPPALPRHPLALAAFGRLAVRSAESLARSRFGEERTRALFAGIAAHGMLPLDTPPSAAFGLVLGAMAHAFGWLLPRGGAQSLTNALAAHLRTLGGQIVTGTRITSLDELPSARAVLCDLSPRPFLRLASHLLPARYRRRLERYRYGMGVFKMDWALDGPIPWRAAECARAGTLHLGGTLHEVARSERDAWNGTTSERPFVLLVQPTLFDPTRAPAGRHIAWGYCHVPHGSTADMLPRIEQQIERFAPGFRDRVLARAVSGPADLERRNANFVGGDIASGVNDLRQLVERSIWLRYATPLRGVYLCSAATPPGVSVHGMCGYFAARRALAETM